MNVVEFTPLGVVFEADGKVEATAPVGHLNRLFGEPEMPFTLGLLPPGIKVIGPGGQFVIYQRRFTDVGVILPWELLIISFKDGQIDQIKWLIGPQEFQFWDQQYYEVPFGYTHNVTLVDKPSLLNIITQLNEGGLLMDAWEPLAELAPWKELTKPIEVINQGAFIWLQLDAVPVGEYVAKLTQTDAQQQYDSVYSYLKEKLV